jgi:CubicO group peptidase (beta-lactamase class C family)
MRLLLRLRTLARASAGDLKVCAANDRVGEVLRITRLDGVLPRYASELEAITAFFNNEVATGKLPGAMILVQQHGRPLYLKSFGVQDVKAGTPMNPDTIFAIHSMTKPITCLAAMILIDDGKLALNDPLSKYIPSFARTEVGEEMKKTDGTSEVELEPQMRPITILDLMRHTSGITYDYIGANWVEKAYQDARIFAGQFDNREFAERIAKLPLSRQPGTLWRYGHSTDVLGRVIEVISGKSLSQFEKERLLDPLGMKDTSFYVTDTSKQGRIAEPFPNDRSIGIDAEFNDPRVAQKWESGGGGMVGTAMDYARFCQMLLNGGTLDGKRILGPKTVAFMTSDHVGTVVTPGPYYLPGPGFGFGLGFAVRGTPGVSAFPGSVGEYNWGGAGGTYFWVDPKEDMFVVFMMQSPKQRTYYRALLKDMIYAAVVKPAGK